MRMLYRNIQKFSWGKTYVFIEVVQGMCDKLSSGFKRVLLFQAHKKCELKVILVYSSLLLACTHHDQTLFVFNFAWEHIWKDRTKASKIPINFQYRYSVFKDQYRNSSVLGFYIVKSAILTKKFQKSIFFQKRWIFEQFRHWLFDWNHN